MTALPVDNQEPWGAVARALWQEGIDHRATVRPAKGSLGPHNLPYSAWGRDINVADYGATGDGATDDTAAIQAAIAATSWPANRGCVYFPPGRYKVTSETLLNGGSLTSTPELLFRGNATQIYTVTPGINVFRLTNTYPNGTTFVKFQNLTFFTNAAGTTAIKLNNTEACSVESCWFIGGGSTAMELTGQNNFTRIHDTYFSNMARGILINGDASWTTISNCQFIEGLTGTTPLNWIEGAVLCNFVKISNCVFYGNGATLPIIRITAARSWSIEGCTFNECDQEGIQIGYGGTSDEHIITGNVFFHMKKDYILSLGGNRCVVANNVFGAYFPGTLNTFSNVRIIDSWGNNMGSYWTITGNVSTETAARIDKVVNCDASCTYNVVTSNSGPAGFTAAGTGCVVANNVS